MRPEPLPAAHPLGLPSPDPGGLGHDPGPSTPERFERARGLVARCRPTPRRPGTTAAGLPKALVRLPMRPRVAPAAALRHRLLTQRGPDRLVQGVVPRSGDGSRLECPRTEQLRARMGRAGKADSAPAASA